MTNLSIEHLHCASFFLTPEFEILCSYISMPGYCVEWWHTCCWGPGQWSCWPSLGVSVAGMEEKIVVESWIFLRAFEDHPSFALFFLFICNCNLFGGWNDSLSFHQIFLLMWFVSDSVWKQTCLEKGLCTETSAIKFVVQSRRILTRLFFHDGLATFLICMPLELRSAKLHP